MSTKVADVCAPVTPPLGTTRSGNHRAKIARLHLGRSTTDSGPHPGDWHRRTTFVGNIMLGESRKLIGWPPALGLLVADASLRPLFANHEAITILTYPGAPPQSLVDAFHKKLRPSFLRAQSSPTDRNQAHPIVQFKSGRRTYFCRAFLLDSNGNGKGSNGTAVLIVLDRGMSGSLALSQISQQFRLTHREQEAVALLLQGLSNKEMAEHMGISANTVKAFLRLVTIKMGVSSRSGIVTKFLGLVLSSGSAEPRLVDRDNGSSSQA
jgi:DNA-binding CsgD family transcriptional regulator